jgi:hypothetical protein
MDIAVVAMVVEAQVPVAAVVAVAVAPAVIVVAVVEPQVVVAVVELQVVVAVVAVSVVVVVVVALDNKASRPVVHVVAEATAWGDSKQRCNNRG